ncbi:MAG TPA: hypothetical protein VGL28_10450 [Steroidobacteraceae bacterium]|jgi:hypothetical protein
MAMRSGVLSVVACLLGSGAVTASADVTTGADTTQGSWQSHDYQFHYMGFTSTYSCDGLADKLTLLLHLSGAGPDSKAIPLCSRGFGAPDRLAEARLKFSTLKSSNAAASSDTDVAGTWRHVEFSPRHPFELQTGDCELIEQFHDNLLPLFDARNVQYQITCVPHQESGSRYSLSFDVLVPAPKTPASALSKGA